MAFFASCTGSEVSCHLMACNEESDGEGSLHKRKLPATGFARPYAARGAQPRPTSQTATSTAISVSIRDGRITKRSCLRSVGRQQRCPAGWASQQHCRPLLPMPRSYAWIHPGDCFNSRSTARCWQGTEPIFPTGLRIHACCPWSYMLLMDDLSMHATSAASERNWSVWGQTYTKYCNKLSLEKNIIFIRGISNILVEPDELEQCRVRHWETSAGHQETPLQLSSRYPCET
eukprot:366126-Chlamydomonas_euryale.AAC.8